MGLLPRLDLHDEHVGTDVAAQSQYFLSLRPLENARRYVNRVDWLVSDAFSCVAA
jgi:hypothetical protein